MRHIEYECLCGEKIVIDEPVGGGVVMPPPCEACGRYGSFTFKKGELYFQGADFLMEELESSGLEMVEMGDWGSFIKLKNWKFTD